MAKPPNQANKQLSDPECRLDYVVSIKNKRNYMLKETENLILYSARNCS